MSSYVTKLINVLVAMLVRLAQYFIQSIVRTVSTVMSFPKKTKEKKKNNVQAV